MTAPPRLNQRPSSARWNVPVLLWLLFVSVAALLAWRTPITTDLSAFLPSAPQESQRILIEQLRDGAVARLVLMAIEAPAASTASAENTQTALATLSKKLAQALRADDQFLQIKNGDNDGLARERELLFKHRYLLSPTVTAERFSAEGLQRAISASIDELASPAGLMLAALLPQDPTGELLQLLDQLSGRMPPRRIDGVWFSRDGKRALLLVELRAGTVDSQGQQRALQTIDTQFAALHAQIKSAQQSAQQTLAATLIKTGPAVFAVESRQRIEREVQWLASISTVIVVLLLSFAYRSLRTLLLGLLPVVSGVLAGLAAVGLGFGFVHGITLGFGVTMIGEAVDYAIYLFLQADGDHSGADHLDGDHQATSKATGSAASASSWLQRYWPTIRLGLFTSLAGFCSLLLSGFPGLAQLGLFSIAGLIAAAAVTRFVLPVLLPQGFQWQQHQRLGRALQQAVARAAWLRAPLVLLLLLSVGVVLWHRQTQTLLQYELAALSPVAPEAQALDASLRAQLGAPDVRYLIAVPGADQQSALQAAEQTGAALDRLVQQQVISGYDNPARWLPSEATQQARQRALPARAELEARLAQALAGLPLQPQKLAPFVEQVEAARQSALLTRESLAGTSLGLAVNALLVQRPALYSAHDSAPDPALHSTGARSANAQLTEAKLGWLALLPLQATSPPDAAQLRAALPPGALLLDLKGETNQLYADYLHEAMMLSAAGLLVIVLLLAAALRSARRLLQVLAPLVAAVLCVVALLLLSGQPLSLLHLVGLLLVVAVGSNYALLFNQRRAAAVCANALGTTSAQLASQQLAQELARDQRLLVSVLFAALTTLATFAVLALSSVPVLSMIGGAVAPGVLLALLFSAAFASRPVAPLTPASPLQVEPFNSGTASASK